MNNAIVKMALMEFMRKQQENLFSFVNSCNEGKCCLDDVWPSITYCVDLWRDASNSLKESENAK